MVHTMVLTTYVCPHEVCTSNDEIQIISDPSTKSKGRWKGRQGVLEFHAVCMHGLLGGYLSEKGEAQNRAI